MIYEKIETVFNENKNLPHTCQLLMTEEGLNILQEECRKVAAGEIAMTNQELKALCHKINNAVNLFSAKIKTPKDDFKKAVFSYWPDIANTLF